MYHVQDNVALLKDYPHIQQRIRLLWGTNSCRDYLNGLTMTTEVKQGFPLHIASVIFELVADHDDIYPGYIPSGSIWDATLK